MAKKNVLTSEKESIWTSLSDAQTKQVFAFSEKYKDFLTNSKTERTATKTIISNLRSKGYSDINSAAKLKPGDKVYLNNKDKSVIAAVVGKDVSKIHLVGSHLDSPRLDLKPNPLTEANGIALLKTHYYGGVKKYQWLNTDLSLYGVIHTASGKKIELTLGEKDDEPKFIMSDLLPHLAKKQLEKKGSEIIEGEQVMIFIGNTPVADSEIKDKVKQYILETLNKQYGLTEDDFSFAELTFVPSGKPSDIGFDKAMIGGYGHDDKCCAFAELMALLDVLAPKTTAVAFWADKEEIGSMGNTGAYSFILLNFAQMIINKTGQSISAHDLLAKSKAISADVTAGMDPSFADVHDEKNAALMSHGVVIEKYTGSGGKYSANDASAEYMAEIRTILQKNSIAHQIGEIGKIDIGGGGTIALFLSRYGMDTIDAGPAVLGMHSPREVISKADLYEAYKLYKAFFEQ